MSHVLVDQVKSIRTAMENSHKKTIQVVVALILDDLGRVLITQRPMTKLLGGLWEFPGGKIEVGEQAIEALHREIQEEIGLSIVEAEPFDTFPGEPTENTLPILTVFLVTAWSGQAWCREAQPGLAWVPISALHHYTFPHANQRIVTRLKELMHAE